MSSITFYLSGLKCVGIVTLAKHEAWGEDCQVIGSHHHCIRSVSTCPFWETDHF